MKTIAVTAPTLSHLIHLLRGLVQAGWHIIQGPDGGRLERNGQRIILRTSKQDARFRIFVYKVTQSSRGKPEERRIEITSTYPKGLARVREYTDVVLGFDLDHNIFVGVDPRRIEEGGRTGNASSFFDKEGLDWNRSDEILVRPRAAKLFPGGMEFHAFIKPPRLAEYLLNVDEIHSGAYLGHGLYSGDHTARRGRVRLQAPLATAGGDVLILSGPRSVRVRPRIGHGLVRAFEQGNTERLRRAKLSPE